MESLRAVAVARKMPIVKICDSICNMSEFEHAALMGTGVSNDAVLDHIEKLHACTAFELEDEESTIAGILAEVVESALDASETKSRKEGMGAVSGD